jgi:hypothetical protein
MKTNHGLDPRRWHALKAEKDDLEVPPSLFDTYDAAAAGASLASSSPRLQTASGKALPTSRIWVLKG